MMIRPHPRSLAFVLAVVAAMIGTIAVIPSRAPGDPHLDRWQAGDIVFLNGTSWRSRVVRLLQGYDSDYSHVGLVVIDNDHPMIVHADPTSGEVVKQPPQAILKTGEVSGGAVYRMRSVPSSSAGRICHIAQRWARDGVPFDNEFDLQTSDRLYCTELIWRAYRQAGIALPNIDPTEGAYLLPTNLLAIDRLHVVARF